MKNAGIRMGAEYLEGLRDDREIWTRGARMKDVTAEPGIQGGAASLAGFLDRQHEEASLDRVALYRLAHDIAVSGFGNRQTLYERFFFGPRHIMNSVYFNGYDKDSKIARVDTLLAQA